ncbi:MULTISPECIES: TetR/AcrR family transcriptional regulator [Paenibacillus]|uniref:TetR/AcrR family transcriptional regulator n=1 Tax=Paenibacillus TaxID=44249 RepID=UPI000E26AEEF|nr:MULTISPECIES: TetR/AcrR family transcriptional regulator [Paenibacillus]MCM2998587.1 TetR/AcrR family transcriptional regulator [Paenibacillus cellulositrophicus]RED40218.1 TetR family transcriptional regulator [Paenibacillus sp. VMFN-D1]
MKKQPQITEKTRQTFIEVFCELYSQKPIEKISVQEIAKKSGYNRSTFYQYFTDIYELLDSVENDLLNDMKKELGDQELSMHTFQDTLFCLDKREHLLVLNALLGDYGSARFIKRLKKEITLGQLELNVPQNHALTPYFIEFYLTTSLSLFRLWIQRQKDLSSEQFFKLVENLYSSGIAPYFKE